jgi:hypothetical protein
MSFFSDTMSRAMVGPFPISIVITLALAAPSRADDALALSTRDGLTLCYELGEWDAGLRRLAVGADEKLAKLARTDLTMSPDAPAIERIVAGHDWWDYAQSQAGLAKIRAQERAAYWYIHAVDELPEAQRDRVRASIETASREADAFFDASELPRPVDRPLAELRRRRIDAAETEDEVMVQADEDHTFEVTPKPFKLQGVAIHGEKPVTITCPAGVEIRGGSIDLGQHGRLVIKGTKDKPAVLRNVTITQDLGGSVTAEHAVFDNCRFGKGGSWFDYFSSKWVFNDCLLYRCTFNQLTGVDYGFKLRRCALVGMDVPEIAHRREGANDFDHAKLLGHEWNTIEACDFIDCAVRPTVAWCAKVSNFLGCRFVAGEAFDSAEELTVTNHVAGTICDPPQQVWDAAAPAREAVKLASPAQPHATTTLSMTSPVPEVRIDKGRARALPREAPASE